MFLKSLPLEALGAVPGEEDLILFCGKWSVKRLSVFGTRWPACQASPLRLMVRFCGTAQVSTSTIPRMEAELAVLFGHPVGLVEEAEMVFSDNPILRQRALASARTLFRV